MVISSTKEITGCKEREKRTERGDPVRLGKREGLLKEVTMK